MIILIDGYNLLRHCYPRVKGYLDQQKRQFLHDVAIYRHARASTVKELIVVFDGGERDHATREVKAGVVIVEAGQKSSADDWIVDYVARKPHEEIALITMDRALKQRCGSVLSLDVDDFFSYVRSVALASPLAAPGSGHDVIVKYERDEDEGEAQELIDQLMHEHSRVLREHGKKDDQVSSPRDRQRSLSKEEKKIRKSIKKL